MHGIHSDVDRPLRACEIVKTNATLRSKVPDASSVVDRRGAHGSWRELVRGIDQTSRTLEPRLNAVAACQEIPAKDNRSQADAAKSTAANQTAASGALVFRRDTGIALVVRSRSISLPERHDVTAEFELATENTRPHDRTKRLGQLKAR